MGREFDKLVRDNIPDIIEEDGDEPIIYTADNDEYDRRLTEKLVEEAEEYRESREVEELADVLEVIHAIRKRRGVTAEQLQEIREQKAKQRGRFDDGVVLERIEREAHCP